MVAVIRSWPLRSLTASIGATALLLALTPACLAADSTSAVTGAQVDALWNQPQGTRVDSAFYFVQAWWDGLGRAGQRDARQRGLSELSQANEDLLNAYTLLQEQRNDPGPHPVAVIDPLLSGAYSFITGVQVKAPIGSVFAFLNQSALQLEGRGTTQNIVKSLLRDYASQENQARRDLGSTAEGGTDGLFSANQARQTAVLLKIADVSSATAGIGSLLAEVQAPAIKPGNSGKGPGEGKHNGVAGSGAAPAGAAASKKPGKP
ncbi:MAG: hypothetical protein PVSMB9_10270 [Candidatus Dormibacteria bacterium]